VSNSPQLGQKVNLPANLKLALAIDPGQGHEIESQGRGGQDLGHAGRDLDPKKSLRRRGRDPLPHLVLTMYQEGRNAL